MSRTLIISFLLCLAAVQIQSLPSCYHIFNPTTNIKVYDLCQFSSPFHLQYNIEPYLNATISFSIAKANTPACNMTAVTWGNVINHDVNVCADFKNEDPVFAQVDQYSAIPGLVITYPDLAIDSGNIEVTLRCNQTAPQNANVDFFVESWENSTIKITGYSYYGCPLKAGAARNFLEY